MGNTTSLTDEYPTRDIINLIVDITDVRVFHKLRRVSKLLQCRVDVTTYGGYYRKFMENDGDSLRKILEHYSHYPKVPITMAEFFDELKKPKCECGNYAWQVSLFSFPPRRICFWGDSQSGFDRPCFPRLVRLNYEGLNLTTQELAQLFNIPEDNLSVLPKIWPRPRPSDLALMDLKTVERFASRKHGDTFMKSATDRLIRDFPNVIETSGWGTSFVRPITVGIYDPPEQGDRDGEITTTLSQLLCSHCSGLHAAGTSIIPSPILQPDIAHNVYPYVPHDYRHLRDHFSLHHRHILEDFEAGWNALPASARITWSRGGNYPSSSLHKMSCGFPQFDSWANSFRAIWSRQTQDMEQRLVRWRSNWVLGYGHLNAWRTRDIQVSNDTVPTDMLLALDGYYMMMEYKALNEFGRRWRQDREGLWKEICEFWNVADVLPLPPEMATE